MKRKKMLLYNVELDNAKLKLTDLYKTCTLSQTVKLNGFTMEVVVAVNRAVKKETELINEPTMEIGRIPKPWRNADGSRIVVQPEPVVTDHKEPIKQQQV